MFALANRLLSGNKGTRRSVLKVIIASCIIAQSAASGPLIAKTYGATVNQGTVNARSGYVRENPTTSSKAVFCVSSNEPVAILGEEKGKDGKTWLKISVGDSVGYIRSDLVTKTNNKVTVKDSLVATKSSQDSSSSKNTSTVKDNTATNSTSASTTTGTIKGSDVRLRKNASTSSGIEAILGIGASVVIVAEGKGTDGATWYQVKAGDKTGFVRSDLVNKINDNQSTSDSSTATATNSTNSQTANAEENQSTASGKVKGTSVRIRDNAGLNSNVITSVDSGMVLNVVGKVTASDRDWYKIEYTYQNKQQTGYIAADFLELINSSTIDQSSEAAKAEEEAAKKAAEEAAAALEAANKPVAEVSAANSSQIADQETSTSIKGIGVRIREVPVTGNVLCQLSTGHPVVIIGETTAEDGYVWYQINFSYQGNAKTGYVRKDFTSVMTQITEIAPVGDEEFEASIASLPDSYKNSLRALHVSHPTWVFEPVDTGLDWTAALTAESSVGKNLVSKNSIASWKSVAAQSYNWSTNTWYTFDGGSWVSASPELIAYYMDPRNFLNESGIYQFENLDYNSSQKSEGVSKMLTGTFMSGDFTDADGTEANYATVFTQIGEMVGVSPYLLAGRALQEQGVTGKSNSISGNVPGYQGYFNYYNIGAYAYGGRNATTNGLIYAQGTDESSYRPWNTRIKSIYGGAKYIAEKYVSVGQNTLYFQKFNVVNSANTIYSHQYMTNIQAASSESARLQLAYLNDEEPLHFRIPFYHNMPQTQCAKPTSDSNPNTYLASLCVDGYELTPAFSGVTENYVVNVDPNTEYINISAIAVSASSAIGGTGTVQVNPGSNTYTVGCKAQSGQVKMYTITVNR